MEPAMIFHKPKMWRALGLAAAAGAGLVACTPGGEAGEHGGEKGAAMGEAGEGAAPAPAVAATAAAGGEAGEAGAASAYEGLDATAAAALRREHLKGFLLAAEKLAATGDLAGAGALVGQGTLEVFDPNPAAFPGLDRAVLVRVEEAGLTGKSPAALAAAVKAAHEGLHKLGEPQDADTVRRLLRISAGLYGVVIVDGGVDPVEYQHSLGAALAAQHALEHAKATLKKKDPRAFAQAEQEMTRLLALWPAVTAPEAPTPMAEVAAQIARVELALSRL
jgi:hypothetical protein